MQRCTVFFSSWLNFMLDLLQVFGRRSGCCHSWEKRFLQPQSLKTCGPTDASVRTVTGNWQNMNTRLKRSNKSKKKSSKAVVELHTWVSARARAPTRRLACAHVWAQHVRISSLQRTSAYLQFTASSSVSPSSLPPWRIVPICAYFRCSVSVSRSRFPLCIVLACSYCICWDWLLVWLYLLASEWGMCEQWER